MAQTLFRAPQGSAPEDVDFALLRGAPGRLLLPGPGSGQVWATLSVFEDRGGGDLLWRGRVDGDGFDGVVLTVSGGVLAGRINGGGADLHIGMAGDSGLYAVRAASGSFECSVGPGTAAPRPRSGVDGYAGGLAVSGGLKEVRPGAVDRAPSETTASIDLAAFFTAEAAEAWGEGGEEKLRAEILNAGDLLNTILSNSAIDAVVNIVHVGVAPSELATPTHPSAALNALMANDSVKRTRIAHRADLVHLFFKGDVSGGHAGLMLGADTVASFSPVAGGATSVAQDSDGVPVADVGFGTVFAHEVGHNMGAQHHPAATSVLPSEAVQPYAYGHMGTATEDGEDFRWRTIMAVTSRPALPRFSSADITWKGDTVGVKDERENARALRTTVDLVSRLDSALPQPGDHGGGVPPPDPEPPPPPPPPPPPAGPPRASFTVDAECGEELCRALTGMPVRFIDTSTGAVRSRRWEFGDGSVSSGSAVSHSWSSPGFYEATLWTSDGSVESTAGRVFLVEASEPRGTCAAGLRVLCLQDSRYSVTVEWWSADATSGAGKVVRAGTNDSGVFSFFADDNWEVLIKVLDGCALNGHVWVYGVSTTDLGYVIRVTDTATGQVKDYRNEPGGPAEAIADVTAFQEGCSRH